MSASDRKPGKDDNSGKNMVKKKYREGRHFLMSHLLTKQNTHMPLTPRRGCCCPISVADVILSFDNNKLPGSVNCFQLFQPNSATHASMALQLTHTSVANQE